MSEKEFQLSPKRVNAKVGDIVEFNAYFIADDEVYGTIKSYASNGHVWLFSNTGVDGTWSPSADGNDSYTCHHIVSENDTNIAIRCQFYDSMAANYKHLKYSPISMINLFHDELFSEANIPDENFRNVIQIKANKNKLSVEDYIENIETLEINNANITSLEGISYFTNLKYLTIKNTNIISLDISHNDLFTLEVSRNSNLETINFGTQEHLTKISLGIDPELSTSNIVEQPISEIDISKVNNLQELNVSFTNITSLNVADTSKLEVLKCVHSGINTIDIRYYDLLLFAFRGYSIKYKNKKESKTIAENAYYKYSCEVEYAGNINKVYKLLASSNTEIIDGRSSTSVPIDQTHFPDPVFRWWVMANYDSDKDGILSTEDTKKLTTLNIAHTYYYDPETNNNSLTMDELTSVKGIEYFPNIHTIKLSNINKLRTVDVSGLKDLQYLDISICEKITQIDVSQNTKLKYLNIAATSIGSINLDNNTELETLNVGWHTYPTLHSPYIEEDDRISISEIDLSHCNKLKSLTCDCASSTQKIENIIFGNKSNLKYIYIESCAIQNLDLQNANKLESLIASGIKTLSNINLSGCNSLGFINTFLSYQLETINLENCSLLYYLSLRSRTRAWENENGRWGINQDEPKGCLESLNLSRCLSLNTLDCGDNVLTELDLSEVPSIKSVFCDKNNISELDLSACTLLESLDCSDNTLSTLNISQCNNLKSLTCYSNNLTSIEISDSLPSLTALLCYDNKIKKLNISNTPTLTKLDCFMNEIRSLDIRDNQILLDWYYNGHKSNRSFLKNGNTYNYICYQDPKNDEYSMQPRALRVDKITEIVTGKINVIKEQPQSISVTENESATFRIVTDSSVNSYQWQRSKDNGVTWTNVSGATSNSYTIVTEVVMSEDRYRCLVLNDEGEEVSQSAILQVTPDSSIIRPTIIAHPASTIGFVGQTVKFNVEAEGNGTVLRYQWQQYYNNKWQNITNATDNIYIVTVTQNLSGRAFRCIVSNSNDTVISNEAILNIAINGIPIDEEHFPDDAFRSYVSDNYDKDNDNYLSIEEIQAVTEINIRNNSDIITANLKYFTEIKKITIFQCSNIRNILLGVHSKLTYISIYASNITSYDLSGCLNLENISILGKMAQSGIAWSAEEPGISSILFGNSYPKLQYLKISSYEGSSIDFNKFPNITEIVFNYSTSITEVDVTKCYKLERLTIDNIRSSNGDHVASQISLIKCSNLSKLLHLHTYGLDELKQIEVTGCNSLKYLTAVLNKRLEEIIYDSLPVLEYLRVEGSGLNPINIAGCPVILNLYNSTPVPKTRTEYDIDTTIHGNISVNIEKNVSNYRFSYTTGSLISTTEHKLDIPIVSQPEDVVLSQEDEYAIFTVVAIGENLQYQWEVLSVNGGIWTVVELEENSSTLTVENDISNDGNKYRCRISSSNTQVLTREASLTILYPPRIITHPQDKTVTEGQTERFSVEARGNDLTYQWQAKYSTHDWTFMRNSNSPEYEVLATNSLNGYQYRCRVWNKFGEAFSNAATLTVTPDTSVAKPTITSQPTSTTVAEGSNATFAVIASGEDLHYQWQVFKNNQWQSISGETNSSYTVSATRMIDGSRYRCTVSNAAGAVYSNEATLTVSTGVYVSTPQILTQPKSVNVDLGEVVTFWVRASGGDLAYQWQKFNNGNWYDITGAIGNTYTLTARVEIHNTRYRCVITNTAGSVYSNSATLSIRAGQDLSFYGYHSIIISGKNTYGEWEMYPTSRPHVAPPEVKTSYVDLPGADGGLDYTDLLTGEPRYGYRKGSWEFMLIPQDRWASVYRSLISFLHGRLHTVILEDDPEYVYTGRLTVNQWQSAAHNSIITIDYVLEPYARNISGEEEDARTAEILDAANELLSKAANVGMVIAKVAGEAALVYPDMLFENGDNIAY